MSIIHVRLSLALAERAAQRRAAEVRHEMATGINSLSTTAAVVPLLGLMGNAWGIIHSFKGAGTSKSVILTAAFEGFTEAFLFNACGLAIAITATWGYHILSDAHEEIDRQCRSAVLDMLNALSRPHRK